MVDINKVRIVLRPIGFKTCQTCLRELIQMFEMKVFTVAHGRSESVALRYIQTVEMFEQSESPDGPYIHTCAECLGDRMKDFPYWPLRETP